MGSGQIPFENPKGFLLSRSYSQPCFRLRFKDHRFNPYRLNKFGSGLAFVWLAVARRATRARPGPAKENHKFNPYGLNRFPSRLVFVWLAVARRGPAQGPQRRITRSSFNPYRLNRLCFRLVFVWLAVACRVTRAHPGPAKKNHKFNPYRLNRFGSGLVLIWFAIARRMRECFTNCHRDLQKISKDTAEGLQDIKSDPTVQLMFASFGSSYKKTDSFRDTKIYTCPVYAGKGLEAVNAWVDNHTLKAGPANQN